MSGRRPILALALFACALAALVAGCGSSGEGSDRPAPPATEFPSAKGKTIGQILQDSGAKQTKLVIAPAAQAFDLGVNRYPFGVFTVGNEQVSDADAALYFAKDGHSPVQGPLPAQVTSLETKPAYRAQTSEAPGEAKTVYVAPKVDFDRRAAWLAIAMLKGPDGLEASRVPSPAVGRTRTSPESASRRRASRRRPPPRSAATSRRSIPGSRPTRCTRSTSPKCVGKKPIVLVFATPALCQSRVCGPVVDVAQQVADEYEGKADFIHMEVYVENEPSKGIRPQLKAFGLPTEPWTFLVGSDGIIRDRIEGAYGVSELEQAMKTIVPG